MAHLTPFGKEYKIKRNNQFDRQLKSFKNERCKCNLPQIIKRERLIVEVVGLLIFACHDTSKTLLA